MGLVADIVATYRGPRRVVRRLLAGGAQESRVLMYLMLSCALIFVAQWPRLRREAHFDDAVPFDALVGGALMGWIFIAPLALYTIALLSHWIAAALGASGTPYGARLALFWALLAAAPLWLFYGLVQGLIGTGAGQTAAGLVALLAFAIFWASGFIETQWGRDA